jgi:hypothetical protein
MDNIPTALIILALAGLIYIGAWVRAFIKWRRAKRKTVASQPVDGTDWLVYDSSANVKKVGHELRKTCYERGSKNV